MSGTQKPSQSSRLKTAWKSLRGPRAHEVLVFLVCFVLSGLFWFFQTMDEEFESTVSVPVRLRDVPKDVVLTYESAHNVEIHVRDKGSALLGYWARGGFSPVNIHYEELPEETSPVRMPVSTLRSALTNQLSSTAQVLAMSPDTLEFQFAFTVARKVPVRLRADIQVPEPYFVSRTTIEPDSVQIYADAHVLDTLSALYTEPLHVRNLKDTLRREIALRIPRGVKSLTENVQVRLKTDVLTERVLEIPVEGRGFPAEYLLKSFPSKVRVTFLLPMSRYQDMDASMAHAYLDYEALRLIGEGHAPVSLEGVPEWVRQAGVSPSNVDFLIEEVLGENVP